MIITVVLPAYMLLGYNNACLGGLVNLPSFLTTFPRIDTVITNGASKAENARIQGLRESLPDERRVVLSGTTGTVVALYTVGCMLGALCCIKLGDRLGRIRTIALGSILSIIGSILLSASVSLGQLIVGRLVLGFGFGCISSTVPVWQSESSPAEHRGALVVLEGAFASIGLSISQWIELGFFFFPSSVSWRFPLAVPIIAALWMLVFLPVLPDSPRWMVKHGRIAEATALMAILEDLPENDPKVAEDIRKMQISLEETGKGHFAALFTNKEDRLLNRTLVAMFSTFSQQINGIGVIAFYTETIFSQYVGADNVVARVLSATIYIWQLLWCFVTFYTVDRVGRRILMMIGVIGMGVMFIIVAGTVSHASTNKACSVIAAICVFFIATFFGIGALGINYLYGTEVAPLAYRVPNYSLTTGTLWAFNFLVVEVTPTGFASIGYKFFIVFAAINLLLLLPGKSIEQLANSSSADTYSSHILLLTRNSEAIARRHGCYLSRCEEPVRRGQSGKDDAIGHAGDNGGARKRAQSTTDRGSREGKRKGGCPRLI